MKLAVLSDIHDNIWKLECVLTQIHECDTLIFCGDLCAPFTMKQIIDGFPEKPIHTVYGNNDGDKWLITKIASEFKNVTLHGEFMHIELDGSSIAAIHYPEVAAHLAKSGEFQAVFYGHNHQAKIEKVGETDLINPGEVMGRFGKATFAIYDTESRKCDLLTC